MCKKKIRYVLLENPVIEMGPNDYLKQLVFLNTKTIITDPLTRSHPKSEKDDNGFVASFKFWYSI